MIPKVPALDPNKILIPGIKAVASEFGVFPWPSHSDWVEWSAIRLTPIDDIWNVLVFKNFRGPDKARIENSNLSEGVN